MQLSCSKNMTKTKKVLITGSTGFIGSHIVRLFCEKGISIGCLVRQDSDMSHIMDLPVQFIYGDICKYDSLKKALSGFDCVIHNAAYVKDWGKYEVYYNTNVEGALNILQASRENGINNIILTGSNSIFGEENCNSKKDENSPYKSHYDYFADGLFACKLNYYRDTKRLAVTKAMAYAEIHNLNLTILNPVWVYGEREFNTGFYEYLKTAQSGIHFLPGTKRNKFHVIYAKDLARAYYLAYEKNLAGINSIIIGNKNPELMEKIYSLFCAEAGIKKPRNLPKLPAYFIGFILEFIYTVLKLDNPPILTRGRVNMFYDNIEYSTEKAEKLLGFTNEYSLECGIKNTVRWYKKRKLL